MDGILGGKKHKSEDESNNKSEEKTIRDNKKMKMNNNRKAMHKRSGRGDSKVTNSSSRSIFDCSDIMREILSRLPVKSLARFKCVSKHWQFTICEDQYLIDLHFTRSKQCCPDLFIFVPDNMLSSGFRDRKRCNSGVEEYTFRQSFLLANLFKSRRKTSKNTVRQSVQKPFQYTEILKPVNGLICFVNDNIASVRILNPSTREVTPWIASSLGQNKKLLTYFFGFDPTTKQHKVICTWRLRKSTVTDNSKIVSLGKDIQWTDICEVLTVGENTWRCIDTKVPFSNNAQDSVYSNGFVYLVDRSMGIPTVINAFDVRSEKFKVIEVPKEIKEKCDHPPGGDCGPHHDLIEVSGHIALLQRWDARVAKLWICEDDTSTGSYRKWTEVTMELPFQWGGMCGAYAYFHGVAGEDQIVIESYPSISRCRSGVQKVNLYSYDWKKKTTRMCWILATMKLKC